MDLGLGSDPEPSQEHGNKRRAVGAAGPEINKQMLTLSKLVLSNSMNIRHVQGAIFDTWRMPTTCDLVAGMREATRLHMEAMKRNGNNEAAANKLGPPHIHAWNSLLKTLQGKKDMTEVDQSSVNEYIRTQGPSGWKGLLDEVRYCRARKTYDKDFMNIDLMLTPGTPSAMLKPIIAKHFAKEPQARLLPGHAAPGALERSCQGWIDNQTMQ